MSEALDVLIIGAGPAGLATAAALRSQGVGARVLERADAVGSTWRNHYERLHLHTHRKLSGLPGFPIPRSYGSWVARADFVSYLDAYARRFEVRVDLGTEVERIRRNGEGFEVHTSRGAQRARAVVVATGYNHTPWLPTWTGRFEGELVHASRYRVPKPYAGRRVLVVGAGNSGAEIAVDLVEGGAADVRLAIRTPPNVMRRSLLGIPAQALAIVLSRLPTAVADAIARTAQRLTLPNLVPLGLPRSPRGVFTAIARDGQIPILDVGFLAAVRSGRVKIVPEVIGFDGPRVLCAHGTTVEVDAVIAATGYRRGLESMVADLSVLAAQGGPLFQGAEQGGVAGLYFVGYRNPITGNLRAIALDAMAVARRIAR